PIDGSAVRAPGATFPRNVLRIELAKTSFGLEDSHESEFEIYGTDEDCTFKENAQGFDVFGKGGDVRRLCQITFDVTSAFKQSQSDILHQLLACYVDPIGQVVHCRLDIVSTSHHNNKPWEQYTRQDFEKLDFEPLMREYVVVPFVDLYSRRPGSSS
ncbi:MAG: hypothetical protein Q9198_006201, partial [Flavoplaca austrocitrina]